MSQSSTSVHTKEERMEEKLKAILGTLEKIDVRGRDNMDRMLGCMLTLEQMIHNLEKPEEGENG